MKYYYHMPDDTKHWLTLKRGSAEWVNADCPTLYDKAGQALLSYKFHFERRLGDQLDRAELKLLIRFLELSDRAFDRKFPNIVTSGYGVLTTNFFEVNNALYVEDPKDWNEAVAGFRGKSK